MGSLSSLLTKKQDNNMNEEPEKQQYIEKHLLDKLPIGDVSNRRELLIAVFKTVKGITIPETDKQIEFFVDKYSN